ncbi:MAG: SDR family oxidoreductase [Deinococcales bacterium]|nr:SDR family oxidoreductase [Deinococcales bacterium]
MSSRLEGKVVIITGATSGIGYRTAEIFVEEGAQVLLAGRRTEKGEQLANKLGASSVFLRTDVTQEEDVEAMISTAVERWGRVDCLFNNASSGGPSGPVEQLTYADFQTAMDLQIGSIFLGIKHVVPVMKKLGGGTIVNNASIAGLSVGYGPMLYSTGKAAVIHMTRCLAIELGEFRVRLNCISPGGIMTPIFLGAKRDELSTDEEEGAVERLASLYDERSPLKRAGRPDDIAYAAVYLASEESNHVTGENLVVDAGGSLGRSLETQAQWAAWRREALFGN